MAKPRVDDPLTAYQLRKALDYDPETGIFTWEPRDPWSGNYRREWNTRYAGKAAGTPTVPRGYVQILLRRRLYLAHRLAFLWMTGEWPESEIDHIDGNPANNRWSNLRAATSSQNKMNMRIRSNNTSGMKGVRWEKRRNHWTVEVWVGGKRHYIGSYKTDLEAKAAYVTASKRLHGEFARSA